MCRQDWVERGAWAEAWPRKGRQGRWASRAAEGRKTGQVYWGRKGGGK